MIKGRRGAVLLAGLISGSAFGAGFQLYTEGSAEVLGQAGAISGRDDLISLAWYNPSALAGAERPAVMAGVTLASIRTDFNSAVNPVLNSSMSDDWQAIPHLYYIQPIAEQWTATLSVNAPYGLITEWPDNWVGSQVAILSDLETVYITPSVAWRPVDAVSFSAGLNVVNGTAELSRFDAGLGNKTVVEGDDINYGGTASAHYQPVEDWGLGIRYQSSVKLDITGSISSPPIGTLPASANLELPSSVNAGIVNTSIKNLSLGLDVVWTEWSTYDQLAITTPAGTTGSPKNWDDVISIRVGGEYALGESWALRAGYVWDESPVPDTTRAPELPGSDRQMLMAGVGWKAGAFGLDLAYSYLWAEEADMGTYYTDPTSPLPGNPVLSGSFETATHLVALSASYAF